MPGLNGGGAAAAVPPNVSYNHDNSDNVASDNVLVRYLNVMRALQCYFLLLFIILLCVFIVCIFGVLVLMFYSLFYGPSCLN